MSTDTLTEIKGLPRPVWFLLGMCWGAALCAVLNRLV